MIFVDADACPVKKEISSIAAEKNEKVLFVASYNHKPGIIAENEQWTFADPVAEASDMYILNNIKTKDILKDIGLASLALQKGVLVLSANGKIYREDQMDTALQFRYWARKERERGNFGKGPKAFGNADRHHFLSSFREILSNYDE
ncbi:DUF188 domain-containing protein [Siminovitchia sp. FSL H7-0308]|uniref:Uncharacterized protein YaiI (UPF0178 family) n=1 Tax=Siminovitchia thermophila TaxID=1245522 RepID=A0ABS2R9H3_9BACI|nr:DUF188 domain-containing protein [Siminovitchia thermophila]MBM7716290.1 uncharacterized protein YaiI (UPF0178 family) [Siminovitchia thermophila]